MMQQQLYDALKAVYPTAYGEFIEAEATDPPFICYRFTGSDDVFADDANYVPVSGFDVELYTDKKDLTAEAAVESALRDLGLTWVKSEIPIESERIYEVVYSIQII